MLSCLRALSHSMAVVTSPQFDSRIRGHQIFITSIKMPPSLSHHHLVSGLRSCSSHKLGARPSCMVTDDRQGMYRYKRGDTVTFTPSPMLSLCTHPTDFPFHQILRLQVPRGQDFYVNRSDGLACVSYACFRYQIQVSMRAFLIFCDHCYACGS